MKFSRIKKSLERGTKSEDREHGLGGVLSAKIAVDHLVKDRGAYQPARKKKKGK